MIGLYRENSDWWLAQHLYTGEEGLVPSNYVIEDSTAPEAQEYVYGTFCPIQCMPVYRQEYTGDGHTESDIYIRLCVSIFLECLRPYKKQRMSNDDCLENQTGDYQVNSKAFCTYVRPLLEYCTPVWSPHYRYLIDMV